MSAFLSIWDEVTQNRYVKRVVGSNVVVLYSAMSLLYFFVQTLVLILALDGNGTSVNLLGSILTQAQISTTQFAHVESTNGGVQLRVCPAGISQAANLQVCSVVFPVENPHGPIATSANTTNLQGPISTSANTYNLQGPIATSNTKRDEDYTMVPVFSGNNLTAFMMLEDSGELISLPPVCVRALEWPYQTLTQARREDIATICFQVWLLVISMVAVFCQSLPHVGSALVAHVLALAWSSAQIAITVGFRANYRKLITSSNGACDGTDLLVGYMKHRLGYEIASIVINFMALPVFAYLAWRLVSIYGGVLFQNADIASVMKKAYFAAIGLRAVTQLDAFFHIACLALWLDEIVNHVLGARAAQPIFLGIYIPMILLVVPFLGIAWYGIQRESKAFMLGFYSLSALHIVGFGAMYTSAAFRETMVHWPFLSASFVTSYVLVSAAIVLAAICQRGFGIGLSEYLSATNEDAFPSQSVKVDMEKASRSVPATFVLSLPPRKTPKRQASDSSLSSTLYSESAFGYSKGDKSVAAAQPASVKILPPVPASRSLTPDSMGLKTSQKVLKLYGKELWGRSKRHESAMSFGHLDARKLDIGRPSAATPQLPSNVVEPFHVEAPQFSRTGTIIAPPSTARVAVPRAQKVDSMGSIYSTESSRPQLYLVTDLL